MTDDDGIEEDVFDVWAERLSMPIQPYNSRIRGHVRAIAGLLVESRETDSHMYLTEIASRLHLGQDYVELILSILAGAKYPAREGQTWQDAEPFSYGTSPRGLFVYNLENAKKLLDELDAYEAWMANGPH